MARIVRVMAIASVVGLLGAARPSSPFPGQDGAGAGVTRASALDPIATAVDPTVIGVDPIVTGVDPLAPDTTRARHLLSRATYGVRAEDLGRALAMGLDAWVEEQLDPDGIDDRALEARLAPFPAASMPQDALYLGYPPPQLLRRRVEPEREPTSAGDPPRPATERADIQREMRERGLQPPGRILFDLVGAKLQRAVYSERQLEAVMTDFWFNHFNVFFAKGADRWLVGEYEREAIRPHVFGRFEEMLIATASHPGMLFYLDNWQNVAPYEVRARNGDAGPLRRASPELRRRALRRGGADDAQIERIERALERDATRGINENYARELLELHTLGVDGGYTQQDVAEVARAFTGWTVTAEDAEGVRRRGRGFLQGRPLAYDFRPELHDPDDKTILGEPLAGRSGEEGRAEGIEVLRRLARHPSTARHVATKLVIAFAADDPPPALVAELEGVFLRTDGDLREVTRTLFRSEGFYDPTLVEAKLKSPFELVASALRVSGAAVGPSRPLVETLQAMGELPYMSVEPTGYPDASEDWTSSGGLLQRVNFGLALASGQLRGVRIPDGSWVEDDAAMLASVLPGVDTSDLARVIAGATADLDDPPVRRRALGLALGSPEFQRR